MSSNTTWRRAMCLVFAFVAVWRLWVALGLMAIAASAPLVGTVAVVGQGLVALVAAFALWNARQALGRVNLVVFVLFVLLQMSVDTFGYGIRSLVEALTATLAALVIAGVAWAALATGRPGEQ